MGGFVKRLKYYGIGFGIGMLFLTFFFQNRGCTWLPSNRVKNSILDRVIVVPEGTMTVMIKKGLTKEDIVLVLNDGDVNFGESDKEHDAKAYVIEKDDTRFTFTLPFESFISEVHINDEKSSAFVTKEGFGDIIHFPADENLVYPDSSRVVSCYQEKLGLVNPKDILERMKESGKVDFAKSNLASRPKPIQFITFINDGKSVGISSIWYKNKINITSFEAESVPDCN